MLRICFGTSCHCYWEPRFMTLQMHEFLCIWPNTYSSRRDRHRLFHGADAYLDFVIDDFEFGKTRHVDVWHNWKVNRPCHCHGTPIFLRIVVSYDPWPRIIKRPVFRTHKSVGDCALELKKTWRWIANMSSSDIIEHMTLTTCRFDIRYKDVSADVYRFWSQKQCDVSTCSPTTGWRTGWVAICNHTTGWRTWWVSTCIPTTGWQMGGGNLYPFYGFVYTRRCYLSMCYTFGWMWTSHAQIYKHIARRFLESHGSIRIQLTPSDSVYFSEPLLLALDSMASKQAISIHQIIHMLGPIIWWSAKTRLLTFNSFNLNGLWNHLKKLREHQDLVWGEEVNVTSLVILVFFPFLTMDLLRAL